MDGQVQRPFAAALIDEADSILIDEARIPLVIAGGDADDDYALPHAADQVVRRFRVPLHCTVDTGARNVALTDLGIRAVENAFACGNLYEERNIACSPRSKTRCTPMLVCASTSIMS